MQDTPEQRSKRNATRRQLQRLHQARSERTARRLADQAALAIETRDVSARALIHSERLRKTTVDENTKLKRENKVSEVKHICCDKQSCSPRSCGVVIKRNVRVCY